MRDGWYVADDKWRILECRGSLKAAAFVRGVLGGAYVVGIVEGRPVEVLAWGRP